MMSSSSHLSASSTAASNASAAAVPAAAAAPAGAGAGAGAATLALDDALSSLSLSAAGAGAGAGADASLAMPSLAASPFHAVSAAANADPFAGADQYVYRSLHADPLGDAPVFRSVGAGGHGGVGAAQYEDMSSFAAVSSSSSSHAAAAAGAGGLAMPMLSASPFRPVGAGDFAGLKAKSVAPAAGAGAGAGAGGMTYTLNPKHQFTAIDNTEAASADVLPPEVPGYLEPAYHFAVAPSLRVLDLFGVLLPVLAAQRVDFAAPVLSADRACKVKCVSYGGAGTGRVPFVVSVFRLDKAGARLVVEFQRRSGCVMHFTNLYRAVKRDLQLKGALLVQPQAVTVAGDSVAAAAVARFADVMPTPSDLPALDNVVSGSQAKKTVELLLEMVASDFTDVKVKAIQMLADLTAEAVYAEALAAVTTVASATASTDAQAQAQSQSQVLACLSHANEDVLRCAISTVANLTHSGVGAGAGAVKRAQLYSGVVAGAQHNGAHVTALCAALHAANSSQQTVREAARALANVVACVGLGDAAQGRVPVASAQHAVSSLSASSDAAAREHAERIAQRLQSAGHATSAAAPAPAAAKALALADLTMPSLALRQK